MRRLLFIPALTIFFISCNKENKGGQAVEIYLLKNYQTVAGKCQVDAAAAVLQDDALIKNADILSYTKNSYQFTLTRPAIEKIKNFTDRTPFAVTVDKQIIYYGIFKPAISSSSCENSITMDIDWPSGNKIFLRLGYPGGMQNNVDDQRNNSKLIATLKNQGKLR